MKFRNPKTGEVFEDIEDVRSIYCEDKYCKDDSKIPRNKLCSLPNKLTGYSDGCSKYCRIHPKEAAIMMGYEVICEDAASAMEGFAKALEKVAKKPTRESILDEAKRCVCGQREQDYGKPENNFETIGLLWGVYLRAAHPELAKVMGMNHINAKDVAVMMALMKVARIAKGNGTVDSFVDCCGYIACGGEIAGSKKQE